MLNPQNRIVLQSGALAFLDTFLGLVPCKIVRIEADRRQDGKPVCFTVARVTGRNWHYKRGAIVTSEQALIVPRAAVKRFRSGGQRVLPFSVVPDGFTSDEWSGKIEQWRCGAAVRREPPDAKTIVARYRNYEAWARRSGYIALDFSEWKRVRKYA